MYKKEGQLACFSQMACICHFVFFYFLPKASSCISGVGSFPVQSGCSLIIFPALYIPPYDCMPPYIFIPPCMAICPSVHHMSPYTPVCSTCHGDFGGICTPHMSWEFSGHLYIGTSIRHFCVCQYICLPLSSYKSHQLLPISVGHFSTGLDAYRCMLSFMLLTFLCSVFILSQGSATTAMITTTPVTVVCSSTSSLLNC